MCKENYENKFTEGIKMVGNNLDLEINNFNKKCGQVNYFLDLLNNHCGSRENIELEARIIYNQSMEELKMFEEMYN